MKTLSVIAVALVLFIGSMTTVSAVEGITAEDAYNMLDPGHVNYDENAYILDVRTPAEWKFVGHPGKNKGTEIGAFLEGKVINIPFWFWEYAPNMDAYVFLFNTNKFFDAAVVRQFAPYDTIILMCKTGGRAGLAGVELEEPSQPASKRLEELGFYNLYNMTGGFEGPGGWEDEDLPYNNNDVGIWKPSDQKGRSLR